MKETVLAGRYRLKRSLGRGSFGETWQGLDLLRGEQACAIKILHNAGDPKELEKEFKRLQSLCHPHVVEVFTHGWTEGGGKERQPFLVSEYINGRPLNPSLYRNPNDSLANVIGQLARALSYLHAEGVVHGDLKPENLLITRGTGALKIIDFGLAIFGKTFAGKDLPAGTLAYMAPEVIQQGHRSKKSDLYAMGLILYQLANKGQLPFPDGTEAMIHFHVHEKPPLDFLESHPWKTALKPLIERLLAKNPAQRPNDALEVLTVLNETLGLSLQIGRSGKEGEEESLLFKRIQDYIDETGALLRAPSLQSPQSFFEEEALRIKKYLAATKDLPRREREDLEVRLQELQDRVLLQQGRYRDILKQEAVSPELRNVKALAHIYLDEYETAERLLKDVRSRSDDKADRARAANYLGLSHFNRAEFGPAKEYFETSLKEAESAGDVSCVVSNAMNLAAIAQQAGRISEALGANRKAHAAARNLRNSFLMAGLLTNMANLLIQSGSLDEAGKYLDRAETLAGNLQLRFVQGYARLLRADEAMWRKDPALADRHLHEARGIFENLKSPQFLALSLVAGAENALRTGRFKDALDRIEEAERAAKTSALPETLFRLDVLKLHARILQDGAAPSVSKDLEKLNARASSLRQRLAVLGLLTLHAIINRDAAAAEKNIAAMEDLFEEERESLPIAYRSTLGEAPRYALLWELQKKIRTLKSAPGDESLWKLVEINKRLASQRETVGLYMR